MTIAEINYNWKGSFENRRATKYIVLHHRGGSGDAMSIHRLHIGNGWIGIGYHFYVRKDGSIYRGRPIKTVGAHCTGYNSESIGVCFEGNYQTDTKMPKAQLYAGLELTAYLKKLYPSAEIKGHRDLQSTACPGKNFPPELLKNAVPELTTANDITWELSQMIEISDVDGFVKALDKAKQENSPLYWGYRKIVNKK